MNTSRPDNAFARGGLLDFSQTESFFVFGAVAAVILALIVGAVFYYRSRRRRRRHHRHHHHHHHHHEEHDHPRSSDAEPDLDDTPEDAGESGSGEVRHRRRRRRRRREHRPRNPTLAETGGLPPIRTEAPPGP